MKQLKIYTPELRKEAVKLVLTQGLTLEDAAHKQAQADDSPLNKAI